jgi:hypothetical protein
MPSPNDKKIKMQIASGLDLANFSGPQQDKIISGLRDNLADKINIALLDKLTEEERKKLQKIVKTKGRSGALEYLNSKIKNLQSVMDQVAKQTVDEFKDLMNKVSQ